jgi:hypothetical protein
MADSADLRPLIGEPVLSKGTNEAAQNMRRRLCNRQRLGI